MYTFNIPHTFTDFCNPHFSLIHRGPSHLENRQSFQENWEDSCGWKEGWTLLRRFYNAKHWSPAPCTSVNSDGHVGSWKAPPLERGVGDLLFFPSSLSDLVYLIFSSMYLRTPNRKYADMGKHFHTEKWEQNPKLIYSWYLDLFTVLNWSKTLLLLQNT